jgi:hypothetical protein
MIDKIDLSVYEDYIKNYNELLSYGQWNDQYQLEIEMQRPVNKMKIPHELVQSFSFKYQNQQAQYTSIGNKQLPYFDEVEATNLDIVLYNVSAYTIANQEGISFTDFLVYKRAKRHANKINDFTKQLGYNLQDYFILDDKGKDILPADGSYLLPNDYNFKITAYSLDGYWSKRELFSGIYVLDGNINIDYSADGGKIQELALTFKKVSDIKAMGQHNLDIEVIPNAGAMSFFKELFN